MGSRPLFLSAVLIVLAAGCGSGGDRSDTSTPSTSAPLEAPAEDDESPTLAPTPTFESSETVAQAAPESSTSDGAGAIDEQLGEQASPGVLLAADGTRTNWSGTIGDDIGFTMWLAQKDRFVRGELTYDRVGEPIMVLGMADPTFDFYVLREFGPDGRVSGTMSFEHAGQQAITNGIWGDLPLAAEYQGVDDLPYLFDPLVRPARYGYSFAPFPEDGDECCGGVGNLFLSDIGDDAVTIEFDNNRGAPSLNIAMFEPTVVPLTGNRAVFDGAGEEFRENCAFEITVFDGFAFVSYLDDRFECGFGNNAFIDGAYVLIE